MWALLTSRLAQGSTATDETSSRCQKLSLNTHAHHILYTATHQALENINFGFPSLENHIMLDPLLSLGHPRLSPGKETETSTKVLATSTVPYQPFLFRLNVSRPPPCCTQHIPQRDTTSFPLCTSPLTSHMPSCMSCTGLSPILLHLQAMV